MLELENMLIIIATIRLNSYHVILVRNSSTTKAFRFSSKSYYYKRQTPKSEIWLTLLFWDQKKKPDPFLWGVKGHVWRGWRKTYHMVIPFQQNIKMITKQYYRRILFALRLNSCRAQGSADDQGWVGTLTSSWSCNRHIHYQNWEQIVLYNQIVQ